jgi:hypothetical protein
MVKRLDQFSPHRGSRHRRRDVNLKSTSLELMAKGDPLIQPKVA